MEQKEFVLLKEVELLIARLEPILQLRGRIIDESTDRAKGRIEDEEGMDFDKVFREIYERTNWEIAEIAEKFYNNFRWLKVYSK